VDKAFLLAPAPFCRTPDSSPAADPLVGRSLSDRAGAGQDEEAVTVGVRKTKSEQACSSRRSALRRAQLLAEMLSTDSDGEKSGCNRAASAVALSGADHTQRRWSQTPAPPRRPTRRSTFDCNRHMSSCSSSTACGSAGGVDVTPNSAMRRRCPRPSPLSVEACDVAGQQELLDRRKGHPQVEKLHNAASHLCGQNARRRPCSRAAPASRHHSQGSPRAGDIAETCSTTALAAAAAVAEPSGVIRSSQQGPSLPVKLSNGPSLQPSAAVAAEGLAPMGDASSLPDAAMTPANGKGAWGLQVANEGKHGYSPATTATTATPVGGLSVVSTPSKSFSLVWKRGRRIGSGSYGCVYTALNIETGEIFAVKESAVIEESESDRRYLEKLEYELQICQSLRHPNIVSYMGYDWVDSQLYIYLEFMPGGSMANLLSEFGALARAQLKKGSKGLLSGLDYLHTRCPPVVHRDVKAANLLVNLNFDVKLADFGLSKRDQNTRSLAMVGSIPWMAPEVIQQQDGHGRKADIWSAGCTIIEMASAAKPWGNACFDNMMFALRHIGMSEETPQIPEDICVDCRDLISSMVRRDPARRPSASDALKHQFLSTA